MKRQTIIAIFTGLCCLCVLVGCYIKYALEADVLLKYNSIQEIIPSPDGKHTAYIFERNAGGATVSKTYELTVLRDYGGFKDVKGNAFASDYPFKIEWISNDNLIIYTSSIKYGFKEHVKGVAITCVVS